MAHDSLRLCVMLGGSAQCAATMITECLQSIKRLAAKTSRRRHRTAVPGSVTRTLRTGQQTAGLLCQQLCRADLLAQLLTLRLQALVVLSFMCVAVPTWSSCNMPGTIACAHGNACSLMQVGLTETSGPAHEASAAGGMHAERLQDRARWRLSATSAKGVSYLGHG